MLIGMEGAAPDSPKHSKIGASDPISPTNSLKYRDIKSKAPGNIIVPDTVDSLRINLSDQTITELTNIGKEALDKIDNASIVREVPQRAFVQKLTRGNTSIDAVAQSTQKIEEGRFTNKLKEKEKESIPPPGSGITNKYN